VIFVIQYNRSRGRIEQLHAFTDEERGAADTVRAHLERAAIVREGRTDVEVVTLEAESEEALLRTHRRYFADLKQLAETAPAA
jgi:hypothetical protein